MFRPLVKFVVLAVVVLSGSKGFGEIKTREIEYKDGDTVLQGYLAYDDAQTGARPGVLVVHEWWGLNDYVKSRARQLAGLGYVAFAVDMYGKGVVTEDPKRAGALAGPFRANPELTRNRAKLGLDVLKSQPNVDTKKLGAIGYCFGGTVCLELARSGADLAGVVGFHCGLKSGKPATVGAIKPRLLVCLGGDDAFVPNEEIVGFENEMRQAGANWEINLYSGAVHAFTNPNADAHHIPGVAYNKQADMRSWESMKHFFGEIFR